MKNKTATPLGFVGRLQFHYLITIFQTKLANIIDNAFSQRKQ